MCNRETAGGKCGNSQGGICDRNAVKRVNGNFCPHLPKVLEFMAQELEAIDWSFMDKRLVISLNERWVPRDSAAKCWLQMQTRKGRKGRSVLIVFCVKTTGFRGAVQKVFIRCRDIECRMENEKLQTSAARLDEALNSLHDSINTPTAPLLLVILHSFSWWNEKKKEATWWWCVWGGGCQAINIVMRAVVLRPDAPAAQE